MGASPSKKDAKHQVRVLQIVTSRQYRGAEIFAAQLSEILTKRHFHVGYLGLYEPPSIALTPKVAEIIDLHGRKKTIPSFRLMFALRRAIKNFNPHIIQLNGGDSLKLTVLALVSLRFNGLLVYRNISVPSFWLKTKIQKTFNEWLLSYMNHVVVLSRKIKSEYIKIYQVPSARISIIPGGVPSEGYAERVDALSNLRQRLKRGLPRFVLMHIGSFTPEKNHQGLVSIYEKVYRKHQDVALVSVGDGPLFHDIQLKAKNLPNTFFLGRRSDVSQIIAAADLLVLPSFIEGTPGALLEAGMAGVPAVSSRVGGLEEIVKDGETGYLVDPHNENEFVERICYLIEHENELREVGRNAKSWIKDQFDIERIAEKYFTLFNELHSVYFSA